MTHFVKAQPKILNENRESILGLTIEEISARFEKLGIVERFRAEQVFRWIYAKRVTSFEAMTDLPKRLVGKLNEAFEISSLTMTHESISLDGTRKFLFGLRDGRSIETVLIPSEMRDATGAARRKTLCVSTQVGCPLDCKFCATASLKLKRNLTTDEILLQILEVERATGEEITNLVYMGMGEPMLNYENVVRSLRIITHPKAELLGKRRITVSTSGLPEEIRKFANENLGVKLALSLHATTNGLRTRLMPINKRYPIEEVLSAMEEFYQKTRIPITYEYILFAGLNDGVEDVRRLAKIARRMPTKINVIPFHPIDFTDPQGIASSLKPTGRAEFETFIGLLQAEGAQVMVRSSSGKDIEAACGQLALAHIEEYRSPEIPMTITMVLP